MQVSEYDYVRLKSGLAGTTAEILGGGGAYEFERDNPWEFDPDEVWLTVALGDIAEEIKDAER